MWTPCWLGPWCPQKVTNSSKDDQILNSVPTVRAIKAYQGGQHGDISPLLPLLFPRILSHFPLINLLFVLSVCPHFLGHKTTTSKAIGPGWLWWLWPSDIPASDLSLPRAKEGSFILKEPVGHVSRGYALFTPSNRHNIEAYSKWREIAITHYIITYVESLNLYQWKGTMMMPVGCVLVASINM